MYSVTRSSNEGHGVCCKPDFDGQHCNNDGDHYCSEPSYFTDTTSPVYDIVSDGDLDHQLFAFCTMTTRKICGIDDSASNDMSILANTTTKTISSNHQYINEIR